MLTFQVEKHIRPVILEHLSYELDVHVLDVDLLTMVPALGGFSKVNTSMEEIPEGFCSTPLLPR